jgi:hypothetical protein
MKKLTAEDLFSLKYGDKVYLRTGSYAQSFDYVGRIPSSKERYLIFSSGETLKHLYINDNGEFRGEWFGGDFDDKFFIKLQIETLEKQLQDLRMDLEL